MAMKRESQTSPRAAASIAVAACIATWASFPSHATQCERIIPVQDLTDIDIFDSSSAARPVRQIDRKTLPGDICHLGRENSRYRIRLNNEEVWVSTFQFGGTPSPERPFEDRQDGTSQGVRLGTLPYQGPTMAVGSRQDSAPVNAAQDFGKNPALKVVPALQDWRQLETPFGDAGDSAAAITAPPKNCWSVVSRC
jgi:hypothetical protein